MVYKVDTKQYERHGVATVRVHEMCVGETVDLSCLHPKPVKYWDSDYASRRGPRKIVLVSSKFKGDCSPYAC